MRLGIIGNGVVGSTTARTYVEYYEVRTYDTIKERASHTLPEVLSCDLVFICVPESHIHTLFRELGSYPNTNFVIRSTVPIGTTKSLANTYNLTNILHYPEFLTERCAYIDAITPTRHIIGNISRSNPHHLQANKNLIQLLGQRFYGVHIYFATSDESEAIKLILNSFFHVKVSFFNEVHQLCKVYNLQWDTVLSGILGDGRITHSHTRVPGPDGKYGVGGKCLPKDLNTLISHFEENALSGAICKASQLRNILDRQRTE